jgi:hypothetical protein
VIVVVECNPSTCCCLGLQLSTEHWSADTHLVLSCRTYTAWDAYISTNMIISNLIMIRTLFRALADPHVLRFTWHMHVNILLNLVTCAANLLLIIRYIAN